MTGQLFPPRNAAALVEARQAGRLQDGDQFVVSFVGWTKLGPPHVFVDPDRRYDWSFAAGLFAVIVARSGIDTRQVQRDLFAATRLYPTFVDFERQVLASIVDGAGGRLKLWPIRHGSESWRALFG